MLCHFENHASFLWAVFPNIAERKRIFWLLICTQKFKWRCSGPAGLLIQLASCPCCLYLPGTSFVLISFLQQLLGLVLESYYFILWSRKVFSTFLHIQLFLLIASSHPQDCSCLLGQEACTNFPPAGITMLHLRQSSHFAGQCPCVISMAVGVRTLQDSQARGTPGALHWLWVRSTGMASVFGPLNCIYSVM